jgi:GMP synthase-like glutamine amidotransferase
VTAFDVVGGSFPDLQDLRAESNLPNSTSPIDAILVTGAVAATYDDLHWIPPLESFIQTVHTQYSFVKIYGSCFGHQLIGQALLEKGSSSSIKEWPIKFSVQAQSSHEIGVQSITLNPDFACRFSPLASFNEMLPFRLQLIHGDIVAPSSAPSTERDRLNAFLPAPWINVGSSEKCLIQGLYYPRRVLTLQGHFEYDAFATAELCLHFSKKFSWSSDLLSSHLNAIWRGNRAENEDGDDSKVAAEAVLLFFAGED